MDPVAEYFWSNISKYSFVVLISLMLLFCLDYPEKGIIGSQGKIVLSVEYHVNS